MFTPAVGGNWSDFENNSFLPEPNRSNPVNIFIPVVAPNYALAIIYWTMFVVGVSGNLLLIYVNAWRRSSKQAATQIFMVSLFVSDLGLLLGATWLTGATSLNPSFYIGRALCKINNLWSILAADGSVIILSIIGLDRYICIMHTINFHWMSVFVLKKQPADMQVSNVDCIPVVQTNINIYHNLL